jgi:hypothetical protein
MPNLLLAFKSFAAQVIDSKKLSFPVKVELLDGGANAFFEMMAIGKDNDNNYQFSATEILIPNLPDGSYTVRFTAGGKVSLEQFQVGAR